MDNGEGIEYMGKGEMVSVIIPTYNREKVLGASIDSVLNQTYGNIELLVVDDGSTDKTKDLVEQYQDKRIHYFCTDGRRGANVARNIGICNAKGMYIAFQDSDDVWKTDKLEKQMQVFERNEGAGVVFSRFLRHNIAGEKKLVPDNDFSQEKLQTDLKNILARRNVISTQTMVVKRECFDVHGMFDESFPRFQDWELAIRLVQGEKILMVDEPLVDVYESEKSISTSSEKYLTGEMMLVKKHVDFFAKYGDLQEWLGKVIDRAIRDERLDEVADCFGKELFVKGIYATVKRRHTISINTNFMLEWMKKGCREQQVNAFLGKYEDNTVVIYGMGQLGRMLVDFLNLERKSKIRYIIDRNSAVETEYEVRTPDQLCEEDFGGIKCIIVTAIAHYEEIREMLEKKTEVPVINLREIVNGEIK